MTHPFPKGNVDCVARNSAQMGVSINAMSGARSGAARANAGRKVFALLLASSASSAEVATDVCPKVTVLTTVAPPRVIV